MATYKIAANCPQNIIVQTLPSGYYDYSEYQTLDGAWDAEKTDAWVKDTMDYADKTLEECKAEFLATLEVFTQEEALEAAAQDYGWPLDLGFVEEVEEVEEDLTLEQVLAPFSKAQEILSVESADFFDGDTTISVKVRASSGEVETFHVQTHEGLHRPSLGCWILVDGSDGDIDQDDYPAFDFDEIIKAAEDLAEESVSGEENPAYINRDMTPYTHRFLSEDNE